MSYRLLVVICALLAVCACRKQAKVEAPTLYTEHAATFQLRAPKKNSICSATAISHIAILTASHCEQDETVLVIDGVRYAILDTLRDGSDHSLVVLQMANFMCTANIDETPLTQTEEVHIWGNPDDMLDQFRIGHVIGEHDFGGGRLTILDINGYKGDSGAAVFDHKGHIRSVFSMIHYTRSDAGDFKIMAVFPLRFTTDQIARVGGRL